MARKKNYPSKVFTDTHASCSKCNTMKPHTDFSKDKNAPLGLSYWCKTCSATNARRVHKLRVESDTKYVQQKRSIYFKHKYGLTLNEYHEKLKAQNYSCAICGVELPTSGHLTHLDHCHATGKIRAFLCTNCNRGLGHFKDSESNLQKAIAYLQSHSSDEPEQGGYLQ